jgi:hypothetical protein
MDRIAWEWDDNGDYFVRERLVGGQWVAVTRWMVPGTWMEES